MIFTYTAVDKSGKTHEGSLEAASEAAVSQLIARQNMRAVVIKKDTAKQNPLNFC